MMRKPTWLLLLTTCSVAAVAAPPGPANPQASREVREVLAYLNRISGKATIIGQHNYPMANARTEWMTNAERLGGKVPGLWTSDFGWDQACFDSRPGLVEEAIRQWKSGGLVGLSWHTVRPMDRDGTGEDGSWQRMVQGDVTPEQWKELTTPGTPLHKGLLAHMDAVAMHLKKLRDAKVPVLWRPYHEMNGGWFWWGGWPGKGGFEALWRIMFDRFTRHHRLNNLIWVWSPGAADGTWGKPFADFFPGEKFLDVLAVDVYHGDFRKEYYDGLLALAKGRPIALGEVGKMPSPQVMAEQPMWVSFTSWAEHLQNANTPEELKAVFSSPRTLGRAEVRRRALSERRL